jgi:hypothetical protein
MLAFGVKRWPLAVAALATRTVAPRNKAHLESEVQRGKMAKCIFEQTGAYRNLQSCFK